MTETSYQLRGARYQVGRIEFHVHVRLDHGADPPLAQLASVALDRCSESLGLLRDRVGMSVSRAV